MNDQVAKSAQQQLSLLRAEASRYKTVRADWLIKNLDRILANPMDWECDDTEPSFSNPIAKPPAATSLLRFFAKGNGLAPHGDLKAMDAHKKWFPGLGTLIRKAGGQSLDYARESAVDAGYLPDDATVADLLNAINEELHGRLVYSKWDQGDLVDCPF